MLQAPLTTRAAVGIDVALEHLLPGLALRGDGLRGLGLQQRAGTPEILSPVPVPQHPEGSDANEVTWQYVLEYDNSPVLSAVLFVHGGPKKGIEKREVVTKFRGYVTNRFYYMAFSLSRSLAEEFLERPQNVVAALAALMRSEIWDRVEQKIRCYEAVQRADVDDEKRYLLANVVENYLRLDEDETARFHAAVRREERQEVGKMIQTFSEALADREARGKIEGMLEATRDAIVLLARSLHKALPNDFEEKLNAIDNRDRLRRILEQVPKVRSLEEIVFEPAH